jgi:hypothetical protein
MAIRNRGKPLRFQNARTVRLEGRLSWHEMDLGSERKPRTPVTGSALTMSDGNDLDVAFEHAVQKAEGEARKDVSTDPGAMTWPSRRRSRKGSDCMAKLLSKTIRRFQTALGIPPVSRLRLFSGNGMEPNGGPRHSGCRIGAPSAPPR